MPIWLVQVDMCSYDEYDAMVVRAASAEAAMELVKDRFEKYQLGYGFRATIVEPEGPDQTILESFNAG